MSSPPPTPPGLQGGEAAAATPGLASGLTTPVGHVPQTPVALRKSVRKQQKVQIQQQEVLLDQQIEVEPSDRFMY